MNQIATNDRHALALFASAFPQTKFRNLTLREFRPMSLNSYWDSGYRDYFKLVRLDTGAPVASIPQNGTPFDGANYELSALPEGIALCVHHYQGTRQSGTIYLNPVNLAPLLPAPVALTYEEKACLCVTRCAKPAYRLDMAKRDCGLTVDQWETAKASLQTKGLLASNGSITNDGRNVIGNVSTYALAAEKSA